MLATVNVRQTAGTASKLDALMHDFDRDPTDYGQRISDLLDLDSQAFYASAIRILKVPVESRSFQFLVGLMLTSNLLIPALSDPAFSREQAIVLARSALHVDPMADVMLAKRLVQSVVGGNGSLRYATRLLDILAEISDPSRIAPSLTRLLHHADPHIRSKAVLMIGSGSGSVAWVQQRLSEADPRTRANAIEALWGMESPEARELLRMAARDGNNRVAGNALIALYRAGDSAMIPEVLKMAGSQSALFRSTAAWVIGETGDPRFSEALAHMVGEANATVRKRAFSALAKLKAAVAQTRQGKEWQVTGSFLPNGAGSEGRRIRAEVIAGESAPPKLIATQFILSEDGQPVLHYQVEDRESLALALTFILPAAGTPGVQAATRCLAWKRPLDVWSTLFYAASAAPAAAQPAQGQPPEAPPPVEGPPPLQFTADRQAAAAGLQDMAGQTEPADLWGAIRRALQAAAPGGESRNVIVYCAVEAAAPADLEQLAASAVESPLAVHAVSLVANAPLEELCKRSKGSFQSAAAEADAVGLIEQTHLALSSRFVIGYQPVSPDAANLTVRAFDAKGWGELTLSIPRP